MLDCLGIEGSFSFWLAGPVPMPMPARTSSWSTMQSQDHDQQDHYGRQQRDMAQHGPKLVLPINGLRNVVGYTIRQSAALIHRSADCHQVSNTTTNSCYSRFLLLLHYTYSCIIVRLLLLLYIINSDIGWYRTTIRHDGL